MKIKDTTQLKAGDKIDVHGIVFELVGKRIRVQDSREVITWTTRVVKFKEGVMARGAAESMIIGGGKNNYWKVA